MKRFRGWKKSTGVLTFVFVLSIFLLPGFVTSSIADQGAASSAGAKAGAATAAGISKGTIVALVVAAAVVAGVIAASGDDGGAVALSKAPSDADSTSDAFINNTSAATQAATSEVAQSLTGAGEMQNLDQFVASLDEANLAEWQGSVSSATTLADVTEVVNALAADGLLKGTLQKKVQADFTTDAAWALYTTLYEGLNSDNPKYKNGATAFAHLLKSLRDTTNINGLKALINFLDSISVGELSAIQNMVAGMAKDPKGFTETLLTKLHPGYTPITTTVHHGGGVYTTSTHLAKN